MSSLRNREIKLQKDEPHFQDEFVKRSFIIVRRQNFFYKINEKYYLTDAASTYLGVYYLVSLKKFQFKDIDSELSFLHKETTPQVYKEILKYHGFTENDILFKMVFTNKKQFSES